MLCICNQERYPNEFRKVDPKRPPSHSGQSLWRLSPINNFDVVLSYPTGTRASARSAYLWTVSILLYHSTHLGWWGDFRIGWSLALQCLRVKKSIMARHPKMQPRFCRKLQAALSVDGHAPISSLGRGAFYGARN